MGGSAVIDETVAAIALLCLGAVHIALTIEIFRIVLRGEDK